MGGLSERRSVRLASRGAAVIFRLLRLLAWFAFGVALAFVWLVPARAETVAATPGSDASVWYVGPGGGGATWADALASFRAFYSKCIAWQGAGGATPVWTAGMHHGAQQSVGCNGPSWDNNGGSGWSGNIRQDYSCPSGSLQGAAPYTCLTGYRCPSGQNWTLSGNQCTRPDCPYGRKADGTCNACPAAGQYLGDVIGVGLVYGPGPMGRNAVSFSGQGSAIPSVVCEYGCELSLDDGEMRMAGYGGPSGRWSWTGNPKTTGQTCTPGGAEAPKEPKNGPEANCVATGMSYGTVNGTVVCVPHGTTQERKVAETTGPAGGKTTTTETRVCTGGSCNSTTTTTNIGGGAAGGQADGTTTSETQGDQSGALQGDGDSECEQNPMTAACLGGPAESEGTSSASGGGGSGITAVALGGGAFCPADSVVTVAGRQVAIPWTHACLLCGYVRPLVVLFGWLIAGYFVVSGLRS